jgi:sarcosine/dimethylglycine N-methyltransferase
MSEQALAERVAAYRETYDTALSELLSRIWGGHLHMGLFEAEDEPLFTAQMRANKVMADVAGISPGQEVIEAACGVGGTARFLAGTYGARVTATNITQAQLAEARHLTDGAGLSHLIEYSYADYHHLPFPDDQFDVWWCQEALLYSVDKRRVLEEAIRTVRSGGVHVVSDLLLARNVGGTDRERFTGVLKAPAMWAIEDWDALLAGLPVEVLARCDWAEHTVRTFQRVLTNLEKVRPEFVERIGEEAVEGTFIRVTMQLQAAEAGQLGWGVFVLGNRKEPRRRSERPR